MSTLLVGAHQVVTCRGPARARRGPGMQELEVLTNAAVYVGNDGLIEAVGSLIELRAAHPGADEVEVNGVLFPGFVDCHTHAVFGAPRLADHERRARGMTYQAIAAEGGGILSSVADLRGRSTDDLVELTRGRLNHLLANGTTTVEVKSGYGLDTDHELRQLEIVGRLAGGSPQLVATFLGAHEVPADYRPKREEYLRLVIDEMLPRVKEQGIARFCDVFCEQGVFSADESRRVLEAGKRHGLIPKVHADELSDAGGAEVAAMVGAASADHLAEISDEGIAALSRVGGTVAVLLPGTMLFLGKTSRAPARSLIDAGVPVALATDFNPGSSPGMSLPLMAMLGVSRLHMLPAEVVIAITVNAAAAIGEAHTRGQIAPGFRSDLVLAAIRDWRELPYWYGANLVREVWVGGTPCHPWRGPLNCLS